MSRNEYIPFLSRIQKVIRHTEIEYTFRMTYKGEVKPGQFFEVSIPKYGEAPISVSGIGEDYVDLTIRKVGVVTNEIFENQEGQSLYMRGPYGNGFDPADYRGKELIVVAGGTGVSPVKGIIDYFGNHPEEVKALHVIAGFKSPKDILFREDIARWENQMELIVTVDASDEPGYRTGLVTKYIPVYSTDNQSLLIANLDKLDHKSLFSNTSDIISYNSEKINSQTSSMVLSFNHPIVHGIDRTNARLIVYLYNLSRYNEDAFNEEFKNTFFANSNITLLPGIGMKLTIPTEPDTFVNTYLGADSKTLKIQVTAPKKTKPPVQNSGIQKIVLDPGHGGSDVGAIRGDITEKAITLDVSKRVQNILEKKGYKVEMTRDTDKTVSLQDRVAFSEERHPDIFVSIHVNSSEKPEITGIETHYYRQESMSLAQTVHASLASNIKSKNRGLFKSKFYVINHTTAPAILVEIGFISNAEERAELVSDKRKQATAKAIAEGVENYFKENK